MNEVQHTRLHKKQEHHDEVISFSIPRPYIFENLNSSSETGFAMIDRISQFHERKGDIK